MCEAHSFSHDDESAKKKLFEELYLKYQQPIHGMATGSGIADPDKFVEEIFLKAAENMHTFDPAKGAVGGWLLSLARRCVIDKLRSQRN